MVRRTSLTLLCSLLALCFTSAASAYSWPFRPFLQQHPIRGFFGDPRTVYDNGVLAGAFEGPGVFSFHQGIDIAAPDGTAIYPSENGTAHYLGASTLNIVTDHDVVFQYFHIVAVVGEGQQVVARRTVLGYVQAPFGHVHLEPYADFTKPLIRDILIRNQTGEVQTPLGLCGRIEMDVDTFDTPPVPVPGKFEGLPVAPALVRWTVTKLGGASVVPWRTAVDFRETLPSNSHFWDVYAKGTYQNAPRFGREQYASMPGRFLFQLAGNYDTTTLANGVYIVAVLVGDGHGHKAADARRFSVLNARNGVCPGSLPAPPGTPAPPDQEPPASSSP